MILVPSLQFPINHPLGERLLPLLPHRPLPSEVAISSFVFCHVTFFFPRSVVTFDRVFCKVINLKTLILVLMASCFYVFLLFPTKFTRFRSKELFVSFTEQIQLTSYSFIIQVLTHVTHKTC